MSGSDLYFFFFFNDTATTEIYTLSLHDALPILFDFCESQLSGEKIPTVIGVGIAMDAMEVAAVGQLRSEEHTSELQSRSDLVCRLLLEKKKKLSKVTALRNSFPANPYPFSLRSY